MLMAMMFIKSFVDNHNSDRSFETPSRAASVPLIPSCECQLDGVSHKVPASLDVPIMNGWTSKSRYKNYKGSPHWKITQMNGMFQNRLNRSPIVTARPEIKQDSPKTWMDEIGAKKKNWAKDPSGGWIREPKPQTKETQNGQLPQVPRKITTPLHKTNSPLWNRRRTSSTSSTPTLSGNTSPGTQTPSLKNSQRGSSASPRMPHSNGFWVQEPDDLHQRWVVTDDGLQKDPMQSPITSNAWPSSAKSTEGRPPLSSNPTSPQWALLQNQKVRNDADDGSTDPSKAATMSGEGGNEVMDFQNRVKRFQHVDAQAASCTGRTTSTSSHVKRSQQSSSNSSEMVKTSTAKSTSNLSEMSSSKSSEHTSEVKSNITASNSSMNFSRSMSKCANMQPGFGMAPNFPQMGSLDTLTVGTGDELQLANPQELGNIDNMDLATTSLGTLAPGSNQNEMKFEERKTSSSSKTKVVQDNNSFEAASGHQSESRKMESGNVSYEESSKKAASKSKLEIDGVTAEKAAAIQQEARQLRAGDLSVRDSSTMKGGQMKISGNGFSAHKADMSEQQQRHMVTKGGTISQEQSRKSSKSGLTTVNSKGVCTQQSSMMSTSQNNISVSGFEEFDLLGDFSKPVDVQNAIMKFSATMSSFVNQLKCTEDDMSAPSLLENINVMMRKAWSVPTYGHELGSILCNVIRHNGGLDVLLQNCNSGDEDLKFSSAKVIEQCLTTENRGYVVEKGLKNVVDVACDCAHNSRSVDQSRVGTGILEHLFKHSEGTCTDIIKFGGLEAVLRECRTTDKATLQHCAGALANLSLYGGSENHQIMMKQKVEYWLFPLAFHENDNIKYYACLAIAALVANKEIEAAVAKAGTLRLVDPFVTSHLPEDFANSTEAHRHGQSKSWLQRLVPVLRSDQEEACNLAAFHFCMEAGIKKKQDNLEIFHEIGAVDCLKEVASSPNAIASRYAAQALKLMGEEVPHKLSQQVPLWSNEDVIEWVKQIGFENYTQEFRDSKVDGDLLLKIEDMNLKEDIQMKNGILRQRFLRELRKLKRIADYSSCDDTGLNELLVQLQPEFSEYAYPMLQSGVSIDNLRYLSEEQLAQECGVYNSIHRQKMRGALLGEDTSSEQSNVEKSLDVFISYRRSNGSQLASLLKVHMSLRNFSVFIDVERLEAGKFDNNLVNSIRQAKNFLLVLSANALDRCIGDNECKDWVHREIVAAIQSGCNIIPILDNFQWPEPETLPEDMRTICHFNGVRWIHEYQEACVDKLERFMRGDGSRDFCGLTRYLNHNGISSPGTPSTLQRVPFYQRTTSIESGKGSSCSDKDMSKD